MKRFVTGDRVTPKDPKALWKSSSCFLTVIRAYRCEADAMRGRVCIELNVRWIGSEKGFAVGQFADDYDQVQ